MHLKKFWSLSKPSYETNAYMLEIWELFNEKNYYFLSLICILALKYI